MERQPDIMIGTPSKIAHLAALIVETDQESPAAAARPKGINFTRPEISFEAVEWVVIDEADVLFDRDYRQTITAILDAVRLARMGSQPDSTEIPIDSKWTSSHSSFNLILTTATIPASLNAYFLERFPNLVRITSPNLHRLPRALQTERVDTAGGNPLASIHKKLVEVFAEGAREAVRSGRTASDSNSQVILFCNRANKATELGAYLENMGLTCLVIDGLERRPSTGLE
ncbi:hypothetical protein BS47DRAFT_1436777 [Hydnum rufescens UP504]|uniref:RNA helicase n=1 Tax=Hydnum rufescens UP504 TaxID=1448309 RepID=A0A9P6B3C8_9AGAM|nr:hypothetical protein BS47DRAFT_1436777 [Hydnum rufescens UP504]